MKQIILIFKNSIKDNRFVFFAQIFCLVLCFGSMMFATSTLFASFKTNDFEIIFNEEVTTSNAIEDYEDINKSYKLNLFALKIVNFNEYDVYASINNKPIYKYYLGKSIENEYDVMLSNDIEGEIGSNYEYMGKNFIISGKYSSNILQLPIETLTPEKKVNSLKISADNTYNNKEIFNLLNDKFGNKGKVINETRAESIITLFFDSYFLMLIICIFLSCLLLFIIFNYFISINKKGILVLRLLGLSKRKCTISYYAVSAILLFSMFLISYLLYYIVYIIFIKKYQINLYNASHLLSFGESMLIYLFSFSVISLISLLKLKEWFSLKNYRGIDK